MCDGATTTTATEKPASAIIAAKDPAGCFETHRDKTRVGDDQPRARHQEIESADLNQPASFRHNDVPDRFSELLAGTEPDGRLLAEADFQVAANLEARSLASLGNLAERCGLLPNRIKDESFKHLGLE